MITVNILEFVFLMIFLLFFLLQPFTHKILKILTFIYLDALGLSRGSWDLVP